MSSKSDKTDAGGKNTFKERLAAMRVEDAAYEGGAGGIVKKGGKKRKLRKSEAETIAQADVQAIASVAPEVAPVVNVESLPTSTESKVELPKDTVQKIPAYVSPEEVAERLVKAMGFSDKEEEQFTELLPKAPGEKREKQAPRLWQLSEGQTLADWRRDFMARFPKLAAREVQGLRGRSNLDSEAMLFIFRKIFGFAQGPDVEKAYVDPANIEFVAPGKVAERAFNLDTSPREHGAWEGPNGTAGIDHHADSSARYSSAFRELYESVRPHKPEWKGRSLLRELSEEDEKALEKFSTFVSYIDSHLVPSEVGWEKAWHYSHQTLFGLTLFYQNEIQVEDIFEFFRHYNLRDAFKKDISEDPLFEKYHRLDRGESGRRERDLFSQLAKESRAAEALYARASKRESDFVLNTPFGRLIVGLEARIPGRLLAAMAHGYDGTLIWNPKNKNFLLNTGPDRPLPADLPEKIGQGVMVRGGMFFQPSYLNEDLKLNFSQFLEKMGVDVQNLPEGRIKRYLQTGVVEPVESELIDESKRPRLELKNPKFKVGNLVKLKAGSKLTGIVFGKSRIIGGENVFDTNFYEVEGVAGRKFPEEEIELVIEEGEAALPEASAESPRPAVEAGEERSSGAAPKKDVSAKPAPRENTPGAKAVETARPLAEETRPAAPAPSAAPPEVVAPAPLPMPETAGEIIDVTTAKNALDAERQEYIEIYQDFLRFKGKPSLLSRLRRGVRGLFKGGEEAIMAELGENAREEIIVARERYLQAKINYAKALYQQEARLLAQEGKSPEEIAQALKQFGQQEIFEKLVIGEENVLQAACAAEWPPMEKGLLRRGFEVWVKLPMPARLLITTGVLTGALFAGGAIGVGAVASTFGIRLARSVAGAIFGQGVSKGIGRFLSGRIAKETGARTEEARGEMGVALANEKFDALNILTEKYHKIFEDKAKREKRKLLAQTVVAFGAGAGASLGLGWLADATMGPGVGAQPEKASVPAAAVAEGKGFEQIIADIKSRGQNLVDELTKQVQEAAEAARLEHVSELATLQKGEGIIHVLSRQLEDDPLRFGYTGNLDDVQATHEWARHLAGQISIKEGYWDPSQNAQKWFVYNPAKPMHFVLSGDAEKGFHIDQSGEARSFIHTGEAKVLPQKKYPDWDEAKVPIDQQSASTEVAPTEPIVPEYSGRPLHWETWEEPVRGHMHMLAEELKAAHELAQQYGTDPNLHPAALAVEQDVLKKIVEYQNAIKTHDVSGYDQALKEGVSWDDYHETIKSELDKEVWKYAASQAGSGGGGVTRVENVAAVAPETPAVGSATSVATEAENFARISKDQYLNTSLSTSDRIDALKEMMAGHDLKLDNISYHQAGQGVRVEIGDYIGWIDDKNIDILKEFHKQFKGITTPGTEATAKLAEKLQAAIKK